jgi:AsmA protein
VSVRNFQAPEIQFQADIDKLDTTEMQNLAAPQKGAASKAGGLRNVTGSGTVHIGSVHHDNLSMSNVKATCALDRGVIRLTPVESELAGGGQAGNVTIDTRGEHPAIAVSTKFDKVDANQLLSSTTSLKNRIYGLLAGEADTRFVVQPGGDIARSLNGEVRVDLTEGKIQGANLLNEMEVLAKFFNVVKSPDAFTTIVRLTGTLKITDGVANSDDIQLDFGSGKAGAAGTIDLASQALNLRLTTALNKELSARVGSSALGVLANSNGEIIIPAMVTGTFAQPRFGFDAKRFAEMQLSGGGVRGIFDAIRGKKGQAPPEGAEAGAKPASPAESLLDLLRRKKSPPPQK